MTVRITCIAGSLRRESFNRKLLDAAAYEMPPGAKLTIWNGLGAVPPFSEDLEAAPAPPGVAKLRQVIAEADGLLFATPEYNGSVPGQLKNAIDWASRPTRDGVLQGKPAAVISASPSPAGQHGRRLTCARSSQSQAPTSATAAWPYRGFLASSPPLCFSPTPR
jgi:chromate reductase